MRCLSTRSPICCKPNTIPCFCRSCFPKYSLANPAAPPAPKYTPNTDSGDFVVVVNAEKVEFTGNKWDQKKYQWHTGFVGGIKTRTAKDQLARKPELILFKAVKGMMPKTSLGRKQLKKLKIYAGTDHPHEAQKPSELKF